MSNSRRSTRKRKDTSAGNVRARSKPKARAANEPPASETKHLTPKTPARNAKNLNEVGLPTDRSSMPAAAITMNALIPIEGQPIKLDAAALMTELGRIARAWTAADRMGVWAGDPMRRRSFHGASRILEALQTCVLANDIRALEHGRAKWAMPVLRRARFASTQSVRERDDRARTEIRRSLDALGAKHGIAAEALVQTSASARTEIADTVFRFDHDILLPEAAMRESLSHVWFAVGEFIVRDESAALDVAAFEDAVYKHVASAIPERGGKRVRRRLMLETFQRCVHESIAGFNTPHGIAIWMRENEHAVNLLAAAVFRRFRDAVAGALQASLVIALENFEPSNDGELVEYILGVRRELIWPKRHEVRSRIETR